MASCHSMASRQSTHWPFWQGRPNSSRIQFRLGFRNSCVRAPNLDNQGTSCRGHHPSRVSQSVMRMLPKGWAIWHTACDRQQMLCGLVHVCISVCIFVCLSAPAKDMSVYACVYIYVCLYICLLVDLFMQTYVDVHTLRIPGL